MTQTPMPDPVAEICSGHTLHWTGSGPIAPLCERSGAKVGNLLITTTQAEAYALTKVREALEQAEKRILEMHERYVKARVPPSEDEGGWNTSCADRAIALGEAALAVRALLPAKPKP